jgi:hypothetical protein
MPLLPIIKERATIQSVVNTDVREIVVWRFLRL